MTFFTLDPNHIQTFLLIFVRIGAIFMSAPLLSNQQVPLQIRAGLSLLLAFLLQPLVAPAGPHAATSALVLVLLLLKEVIVGLIIGYAANLIFSIVDMAGEFQDTQAGFGFAGVVDLSFTQTSVVLGQFQTILMWMIFLTVNGHHALLQAIADSFQIVPLGGFAFTGSQADHMFRLATTLMLLALRISGPIIASVMLTDMALGVLQRTAPQLNLLAVGFQVKIAVAITVLSLSLPFILGLERDLVPYMGNLIQGFLTLGR